MTKKDYADLYNKKILYLVGEYDDPDEATEQFEKTASVEEVVGYYVFNEGDWALKQWLINTEGIVMTDRDREIERILEELYPYKYEVTENQLRGIVEWAQSHPSENFCSEPMNDGEDFLSCCFFNKYDDIQSGYWELSAVK